MAITLRGTKGSELTFSELDGNFTDLEGQILSGPTYFATVAALEADTTTIAEYRTKYGATGIVKVTTFAEGYQYHLDLEQLETHHIVNAQGVEFVSLQSDWPAFGADATGATDTTAKIITAVEWAVSREVPSRIGEGTFQVSGQILDYADRAEGFPKIVGAGRNITTLTLQGEIIAPVFSVYGDVTAYGSTQHGSGLSFEDFTVVGDGTNIQNVFDLAILSSFDFKTVNCFNCRGANLRMRECWEGKIDAQFVRGGNCFSLPYDASTGTITAGDTLTGPTSGATANVMRVYGGYLDVSSVTGTFADNEVVNAPSGTITLDIPTGIVGAETPAVLLDYFFATDITNSACNNIVFHGTAQIEASLHRAMEWYDGTRKVSYSGKIHLLLGSAYDFEAVLLQGCMNSQIGPGADISWSGIVPSVKIISGPAFIGAENSIINSDVSGGVDIVSGNRMIVVGNTGDIATSRTSLVTITGGTDALVHSNQYSGGSSQVEWGGVGFSGRVQPFEAAGIASEAQGDLADTAVQPATLNNYVLSSAFTSEIARLETLIGAAGETFGILNEGNVAQINIPPGATGTDTLSITFDGTTYTADYAATTLTVALVEAGPVALTRPTISGVNAANEDITTTPAIWLTNLAGTPTFQPQIDGVDIAGDGLTHTIIEAENGTAYTVEETFGGVMVESLPFNISFASAALSVVDDFSSYADAADIPTVSADWSYNDNASSSTDRGIAEANATNDAMVFSTAGSFKTLAVEHNLAVVSNHYAEITVGTGFGGTSSSLRVHARMQANGDSYYIQGDFLATGLTLQRRVGGTTTEVAPFAHQMATGDILRLEAVGGQIDAYLDTGAGPVLVMQYTDGSPLTDGSPGVGSYQHSAGNEATITNFRAGDL